MDVQEFLCLSPISLFEIARRLFGHGVTLTFEEVAVVEALAEAAPVAIRTMVLHHRYEEALILKQGEYMASLSGEFPEPVLPVIQNGQVTHVTCTGRTTLRVAGGTLRLSRTEPLSAADGRDLALVALFASDRASGNDLHDSGVDDTPTEASVRDAYIALVGAGLPEEIASFALSQVWRVVFNARIERQMIDPDAFKAWAFGWHEVDDAQERYKRRGAAVVLGDTRKWVPSPTPVVSRSLPATSVAPRRSRVPRRRLGTTGTSDGV